MRNFYLLMGLLLLGACDAPKAPPLRVAINPWPGYEVIYLAAEKGFFAAEGVAVEVLQVSNLSDARRMFERGQADGIGCTVIEMLQARELSPRFPQVVYVADYSNGGDLVMAKSAITELSLLRGKRVAFEAGTLNLFMLSRALARAQLTISDVHLVAMTQAAMRDALVGNLVDAIVTYPPFSIAIANEQLASPLFTSRDIPGEVLDIVVFDADIIQSRARDIEKFIRALNNANRYIREQPLDAYTLMSKREGVSVAEFQNAIENDLHVVDMEEQAHYFAEPARLTNVITAVQTVLKKNGELKADYPPASFIAPVWAQSER